MKIKKKKQLNNLLITNYNEFPDKLLKLYTNKYGNSVLTTYLHLRSKFYPAIFCINVTRLQFKELGYSPNINVRYYRKLEPNQKEINYV